MHFEIRMFHKYASVSLELYDRKRLHSVLKGDGSVLPKHPLIHLFKDFIDFFS
jgi:hypothetical protein